MTTRTYRCFRCWTTILLILVAAYEASHLVAMGGADKRSGLIFLGLLVAAFLTVGLSSEILIEGSPIRFAFYLAAIGLFLYTSLAENRTRLTRRIQRVQSGERLKTTLQDVRNRASVLLEQAKAEQDARQPKAAAAKENIEAQIPHFKELRSELIAARNECPPNDERVATAEQDFQEARRRLRPYLVEQRTQNARLQVLKQVTAGAQKVMRPFEKEPATATAMDSKRQQRMNQLYALECLFGGRIGRNSDPEIIPALQEPLSPVTIYRWALHNHADYAVGPLRKSLILNALLSFFAFLVGQLNHSAHQTRLAAIPIDRQKRRVA